MNKSKIDDKSWDKLLVKSSDQAHYMQSSGWGELKNHANWPTSRLVVDYDGRGLPVQVFSRVVPGLGRVYYAPEVSSVDIEDIPKLTEVITSKFRQSLTFKLELYQPYNEKLIKQFMDNGWQLANSVQHRSTVVVDLDKSEQTILASMKKRARYEIRVAERNNVVVKKVPITDKQLDILANLMEETARRTGAYFRDKSYVNRYWNTFNRSKNASLYFAWHDKTLLAGAFVITIGKNAWYKDGGSVRDKSELFGPRYLQWEIMKDLHSRGIKQYDLSGIPAKQDVATSSLKGLYTFKTGFSNDSVRMMPALELAFGKRYRLWPKAEHQFLRLYSGLRKDFWY